MSEQNTTVSSSVPPVVDRPKERADSPLRRFLGGSTGRNLGLVIALALLVAVGAATAGERFLNLENMLTIVRYASIVGVISIGATFVIIATCGRTMLTSGRISSAWFMPISNTPNSASAGMRQSVSGTPR